MIHRWMVQCLWKNNLWKLRYLLVFKIINFLKFYKEFRSSLFFIFFIFNWNLVKKINKTPWVQFTMGCLRGLAHGFKTVCKAKVVLEYPCKLTIFSLCTGIIPIKIKSNTYEMYPIFTMKYKYFRQKLHLKKQFKSILI